MSPNEILMQKNMTKYCLWKESGVPQATISDICTGKTSIEKCSAETIYHVGILLGTGTPGSAAVLWGDWQGSS